MRLSRPVVSLAVALISAVLAVSGLPTAVKAVQVSTSVTWISTPTSPVGIYDPLTFSAKVYQTPPDGGTMDLVKNGSGLVSDDLNPNGVASFTLPYGLLPGTYTFEAKFNGTASSAPSTSAPLTIEVIDDRTAVTVTLTSGVESPSLRGDPIDFQIAVSPDPGSGSVQLYRADTDALITLPIPIGTGGVTHVTWTPTATFDYSIKACFSGNVDFQEACSAPIEQDVYAIATTTTLEILQSPMYQDESVTFRVTVDPPPEIAVNARVGHGAFDGYYVGIDPVTGIGETTLVPFIVRTELGLAHHDLIAFYPGSPHTDPSQSSAQSLDIVQDATTTTGSVTPAAIKGGQHATISVSVDPPPTPLPIAGVSVEHPIYPPWVAAVDLDVSGHGSVDFDSAGWPDGVWDVTTTFGGTDRLAGSSDATTITIDSTGPTGAVSIAGGASRTSSAAVTLDVTASDALGRVSQVALSNDGVAWAPARTYTSPQAWTLTPGNGLKIVFAKWKDALGNWSDAASDTIVLAVPPAPDVTPPTVTAPRRGFVVQTAISSGNIAVRLPWSGSDARSGIARYELAQSTDGGAWTTVSTTLTSPTATRLLAPLHTYAFRVRAVDRAGNIGTWATGATFRISRYSEFNSAIAYSGTWANVSSPVYWGGAAKKSVAAGAKASLTFTGRSIAWVARTGPDRGKAAIYVNGTQVVTVDLYSASFHNQRVVWVGTWTSSASRRITIKNLGTSRRPRIDLDALVTAN